MIRYHVSMNRTTRVATVRSPSAVMPIAHESLGFYDHNGDTDLLDSADNHVMLHHVRDLLFGQGILSTQLWVINYNMIEFLMSDLNLIAIDGNPISFN